MRRRYSKIISIVLVLMTLVAPQTPGFGVAFADEPATVMSDPFTVMANRFTVRFYHTNEDGEQVLYQEDGYANPQIITAGELPVPPSGTPDEYPGFRFTGWSENASQIVLGNTDIYALYEPLGTVSHIVEFVNDAGAYVGDSYFAIVKAGAPLTAMIPAPSIRDALPQEERAMEGFSFTPDGQGGGTVAINIEHAQEDCLYRIIYGSQPDAPYEVDHYVESEDGSFAFHSSVTLSGPAGSLARPQAIQIDGYALATDITKVTDRIASDGSTRIRLEYTRNQYSVYYDPGTMGILPTGTTNPVLVRFGDPIPMPGAPSRMGYTFDRWVAENGLGTMPARDIIVTAGWTEAPSNYLVVVWGEEIDKDPSTGTYDYYVMDSIVQEGVTGSAATFAPKDYEFFTFDHAEPNIVVRADGSTVLNVYYTRNSYTLTFQSGGMTIMSITDRYGADLSAYYNASVFQPYLNVQWQIPQGKIARPMVMPGIDRTLALAINGPVTYVVTSMRQPLDGNGRPVTNKSQYTLYSETYYYLSSTGGQHQLSRYSQLGYEAELPAGVYAWSSQNTCKVDRQYLGPNEVGNTFYFNLRQYDIAFSDRGRTYSTSQYYTAPLNGYGDRPELSTAVSGYEQYTFGGWYETQDFTGQPFEFNSRMPSHNLVLYAKWDPPVHNVSFDTMGGSQVEQQQIPHGEYATRPTPPTLSGRVFEGWYRDAAHTSRFLFSQPVLEDMTLYAKWSGSSATVAVRHVDESGDDLVPASISTGPIGETVTLYPQDISGYLPTERSQDVLLGGPVNLVVFRYVAMHEMTYTVYYKDAINRDQDLLAPKDVGLRPSQPTAIITETREIIPGYTPDAMQKTVMLVHLGDNTITFYYTPTSSQTTYSVVNYLERITGGFDAQAPITHSASLGAQVQEQPDAPEGFVFDDAMSNASGTVLSGGVLQLNMYYRRQTFSYDVEHILQKTGEVISQATRTQVRYGQQVTESALDQDDLRYLSYAVKGDSGTDRDVSFTVTEDGIKMQFDYVKLYKITATAEGGSITPPGTVTVDAGNDQTFAFAPEDDYVFESLLVDGVAVPGADQQSYTFTGVDSDHTIEVRFVPEQQDMTITARDQRYTYNGAPQGTFGQNLDTGLDKLVSVTGLKSGHTLRRITIQGNQRQEAKAYPNALTPAAARIEDADGNDVTGIYTIDYVSGTLTIDPKGNGQPEPGGGEKPMDITAASQTYTYNGQPQGMFGSGLAVAATPPLAVAVELVDGHTLKKITLTGGQEANPATYAGRIVPSEAVIVDAGGSDVTHNYRIEASSYHPGDLIILSLDNPPNVVIRAADQSYLYNGTPQGVLGSVTLNEGEPSPLVTATGLLQGHRLASAVLDGSQQTEPGTYENSLMPRDAVILDADSNDVTAFYALGSGNYKPGTLTIRRLGEEGDLRIIAADQHFTYNELPQGTFGTSLTLEGAKPLARAEGLLSGHVLAEVSLAGNQQVEPGTYSKAVTPTQVRINDAGNNDVTDFYTFTSDSFVSGDLIIDPKGNGNPDPEGGEEPLDIYAMAQAYVYNGRQQGKFGAGLPVNDPQLGALARAEGLLDGHSLQLISLLGSQQELPATYPDAIAPLQVKIVDAGNKDVTSKYRIEASSYHAADLVITKKGNGTTDPTEPNGGEYPLDITAQGQRFTYNEKGQGTFGENLLNPEDKPLATAVALVPGHRLLRVSLDGTKQVEPGTYQDAITPTLVQIVDGLGNEVTPYYRIEAGSYHKGDLIIDPKGNGNPDPEGGEEPLDIDALTQAYVYNGRPQGIFGNDLSLADDPSLAEATGLLPGHVLRTIALTGTQQTDAGEYQGALVPAEAVIFNSKGENVTSKYRIEQGSYHAGDLIITPKGNGITDPKDPNGGELPLDITATRQAYVFNDAPQGLFGSNLTVATAKEPLATAEALVGGQTLVNVTLTGDQKTLPDTYEGAIMPSQAVIYEGAVDVTHNYRIEAGSYHPGDLVITKKGNGTTDPKDPDGGELPLDITAADQKYVYNGKAQGVFGHGLTVSRTKPEATATGLLAGHRVQIVSLLGQQKTVPGEYADAIHPLQARIYNAADEDVTGYYRIEDSGYHAGALIITRKGNGITDPDDPNGGEYPLDITAAKQTYVYNGQPQGQIGSDLTNNAVNPLATADTLVTGHRIALVSLDGEKQTVPGTYADTLLPTKAVISDADGEDVTAYYRIEGGSYHPGTLIITPKGNGITDPDDPDGGEYPLEITAKDQTYAYDGSPKGQFGEGLDNDGTALAGAVELAPGHTLSLITLTGTQQSDAGRYPGAITPAQAVIKDAENNVVTDCYRIESQSYIAGTLIIEDSEDKLPVVITAAKQSYVYNGSGQGRFGVVTIAENEAKPLATAQGLLFGHRLARVTLSGTAQSEPDTYAGAIVPSTASIVDALGNDVTYQYAVDAASYLAGDLVITPKGNGTTDPEDPNGGEQPLDIYAIAQTYVYNGQPQAWVGNDLSNTDDPAVATATGLLDDHHMTLVSLAGTPQAEAGRYPDALMPTKVVIVDGGGTDVTSKYRIENGSYHPADLIITPKGNGITDPDDPNGGELPLDVTALQQTYIYNGRPQGAVGPGLPVNASSPLAEAKALVEGHVLKTVSILGARQTDAGGYPGTLVPVQVAIVDGEGDDVTRNYRIESTSYHAGDLTIKPKGNGQPDPKDPDGELPLDITALSQVYTYNEQPQGRFGNNLEATADDPLGTAETLVPGHRIDTLTLDGTQEIEPDTYTGAIVPADARIVDAADGDVTANYRIEASSYHAGDLVIKPKGNGNPDPEGGEEPLDIYAKAQRYVYNGAPQGIFGDDLSNTDDPALADATGLLPGHTVVQVSLTGTQRTNANTYPGEIVPAKVVIFDASNQDVTSKYRIEDSSYHAGDLVITPKGNGITDPEDPDGGELPLDVTAMPQEYIYNGKEQGAFGNDLTVQTAEGPLAIAEKLVGGHTLDTVSLTGTPRTDAGTYPGAIVPTGVQILDADRNDVTENYRLEAGSYHAGILTIYPKGNGKPDPEGGEEPLDVTAVLQRYIYNGRRQGRFGAGLAVQSDTGPLATADGLLDTHVLATVTLAGMPQMEAKTYTDEIIPVQARIQDGHGTDITRNYRLTDASYHPADLVIAPRGGGGSEDTPIQIHAEDQTYIYNGKPQGRFGTALTSTTANPLAESADLLPGHRIQTVTLTGDAKTAAGSYAGEVVPSVAKIVDAEGVDVTLSYLIAPESYMAGDLTIYPKGNGKPDPEGGEYPLDIRAADQTYVYNGSPQGVFGDGMTVSTSVPQAMASTLVAGEKLSEISIQGQQETAVGEYADALTPADAKIADSLGRDVTSNYRIEADSYHKGKLTILPDSGALPLVITAVDQKYVYNEQPQGTFGTVDVDSVKPLAKATGLLSGHRLAKVTLAGSERTDPNTYLGAIVPTNAVILDADNNDVTAQYAPADRRYVAGNLVITKKGNGTIDPQDPNEGEYPLDITAADQRYVYNGKGQGVFGASIQITNSDPKAAASGLLAGHRLELVALIGTPQTDADTYPDAILPARAKIVDKDGEDVTDKYRLEDSGYHAGTLTILPKGNGKPDGKGGELPLDITATKQAYVYNGQPQGVFGKDIAMESASPLATAATLVAGQRLSTVTLLGGRQTDPATYTGAIMPDEAHIVDASGVDQTRNYLIEAGSYHPADLVITKKGNGTTDPQDPDEGEYPLDIQTLDQRYVYNGKPQGAVDNDLTPTDARPLVHVTGLLAGHTVKTVSIQGEQQTEVGNYPDALLAADIHIVDEHDIDVTAKYRIEDSSYTPGTLAITPKGNGTTDPKDPEGGEEPLDIYALAQIFIYNGAAQGIFGDDLSNTEARALAEAIGLLEGHSIRRVALEGTQQTEANRYVDAVTPTAVAIVDEHNDDVTDQYRIEAVSYHKGDLVIKPKGNGVTDPTDPDGGELPLDVTATKQAYVYNELPQGIFGDDLAALAPNGPLAAAEQLVDGHRLETVTLTGSQQTVPDTYTNAIVPSEAVIFDADDNDVTGNYRLEVRSYHAGDLVITPKGNGTTDPDNPDGGEYPLDITASVQRYVYNGRAQGRFGQSLAVREENPEATADGLLSGHRVETISLLGRPEITPDTYSGAIHPLQARIYNAAGEDVTGYYRLEDSSYHAGDLIITPKGNGTTDPGDPNGGEYPLEIYAAKQTYVYNGAPQGRFGNDLTNEAAAPLATAKTLVAGHRIRLVSLAGEQQTIPKTYPDAVTPAKVVIVDGYGEDVTDCYRIEAGSYYPADLVITPKGNGVTDPEDPDGGEFPLEITALDQVYAYDGDPKGQFGDGLDNAEASLAGAAILVPGHTLSAITLTGEQQTNVGRYADSIVPSEAVIKDAENNVVTDCYRIEAGSYIPGTLVIEDIEDRIPVVITAADQCYVYNEKEQGRFGEITLVDGERNPLATATGLHFGHRLSKVMLDGEAKTDPDTYAGAVMPRGAAIVDGSGADVTYLYEPSYLPGNLVITKKGNGTTDPKDPNGGEYPLDVTALEQRYIYNGKPQGVVGDDLSNTNDPALVTATGLLEGHSISYASLDGTPQTDAGRYVDELKPVKVVIIDGDGEDVTSKYRIEAAGMHSGDLLIGPKGGGEIDPKDPDGGETPLMITARNQTYIYNGAPQGVVGASMPVGTTDPLAVAKELVEGHALQTISILGTRQTDVGVYADKLVPLQAIIVDENGVEVTDNYRIEAASYVPGTLTITPKGNGKPDPEDPDKEQPLDITALRQVYTYNEQLQGRFGKDIEATAADPLGTAATLIPGHRIASLTLDGTQQIEPHTYTGAITPADAVIVDAAGKDMTANYRIEAGSYHTADLVIKPKGNGTTDPKDPDGGEHPLDITAKAQRYVYNGAPQGVFGDDLSNLGEPALAEATGLLPGHKVAKVSLDGTPQTEAGTYGSALMPTKVVILDRDNNDVTGKYRIEDSSYHPGDLIITPKGNGTTDPTDPDGGELPLDITATKQAYVYSGEPQGVFGDDLAVAAPEGILATAAGLIDGHTLDMVSLTGEQKTDVGAYRGEIVPAGASIQDEHGNDVTANYRLEAGGYHAGDLIITPKGNGTTDPTDPDSGELPLDVTAIEQRYIYNGEKQGRFGASLSTNDTDPLAVADGLVNGHTLVTITLAGVQQAEAGTYEEAISPHRARIQDASGEDVTSNYRLTDDSYHPANLVITPRGGGGSGDTPIEIHAANQVYVYNGRPQGRFGEALTSPRTKPLADSTDLLPGHRIQLITLAGEAKTDAGTYGDAITPSEARIVDAGGRNVTPSYLITDESYIAGDLIITPKGNGKPDPEDPNGGELPLDVTAHDQTYVYNGKPQGTLGDDLAVIDTEPIATAIALADGHRLAMVTIRGERQTQPSEYPDALTPSGARIEDAQGHDVTANYRLEDSSYHAGKLTILNDPSAMALVITAMAQHYTYNEQPQGVFGEIDIGTNKPLATATGLLTGHRLVKVALTGDQQIDPATYAGAIEPNGAVILDDKNNDITSYYTAIGIRYEAGDLVINPKGNGKPDPQDPDGGEMPLDVTASDQSFLYNGQPQGTFGNELPVEGTKPIATADGLLAGHSLRYVSLTGTPQTDAGDYAGAIVPSRARIVDRNGNDVTEKYRLEDSGYHAGALTILPKGNGQPDGKGGELPVNIRAARQTYIYNGSPQGTFGIDLANDVTAPLATVETLVPGHRLERITLLGSQEVDPSTYTAAVTPYAARIVDAAGKDQTRNYLIVPDSYFAADLIITPKGNGTTDPEDPNGGELPLDILTLTQTYIYNGKPQGKVGNGLAPTEELPLARITGLLNGHRLRVISIQGDRKTDAGVYTHALLGEAARIVDAAGKDVTDKYRIEDSSYAPGNLVIKPKGNGQPDGEGGELPLEVAAATQIFLYTGKPLGIVGTGLPIDPEKPLAAARALVPGQRLKSTSITGKQQVEEGVYLDSLMPSGSRIVDETGADVTDNYLLTDSSYRPGSLIIRKGGAMYILTVFHVSADGKNLAPPNSEVHMAGDRYGYRQAVIKGYTATHAVIYQNDAVVNERAPVATSNLLMPGADVSVYIHYKKADGAATTPPPTTETPDVKPTPTATPTATPKNTDPATSPTATSTPTKPGPTTKPGGNTAAPPQTVRPGATTRPGSGGSGATTRPGSGGGRVPAPTAPPSRSPSPLPSPTVTPQPLDNERETTPLRENTHMKNNGDSIE